jgi:hypothetical protein
VGDFWLDARLVTSPSGVVYLAHEESQPPVMVLLLSQGAADDAAARGRLAGQVNQMHIDTVVARGGLGQDSGRLSDKFRREEDDPPSVDGIDQAPWAALRFDGSGAAVTEARRLLAEIDLSWLAPQGRPAGPDYQLPWVDRPGPGLTHVWPLPWPGRRDRAGRLSILASWLLMLLLAAVALLIAILIFSQAPPQPPPPPVPSQGSGSPPPSASPSPSDGSPSPSDGSPSPSDGSPSPGESESASPSPDPSATASESGGGSSGPSATASSGSSNSPPSKL